MDLPAPQAYVQDGDDATGESWKAWKQGFQVYLAAKNLDQAAGRQKVNVLLHILRPHGVKIYSTFKFREEVRDANDTVITPAEDKEDLDTVLCKFDEHFGPKECRNYRRQDFLERTQQEGESVMDFVADLKHKARECGYGPIEESMICDKVIQGVRDQSLKMRLLDLDAEEQTLVNVVKLCKSSEYTQKRMSRELSDNHKEAAVHQTFQRGAHDGVYAHRHQGRGFPRRPYRQNFYRGHAHRQPQGNCVYCCRSHGSGECPAYERYCGVCGQKGHYGRSTVCPQAKGHPQVPIHGSRNYRGLTRGSPRGWRHGRGRFVHYVDCDNAHTYERNHDYDPYGESCVEPTDYDDGNDDSLADMMYEQCQVNPDVNVSDVLVATHTRKTTDVENDWKVDLDVQGTLLTLDIDTGAQCNVVALQTLKDLNIQYDMMPSSMYINGVHGSVVKAVGEVRLRCSYKGTMKDVCFQVLNNVKNVNVLGRSDSVNFGLVARVHSVQTGTAAEKFVQKYSDVFNDKIGCIPGEYDIKLKETREKVIHPPRPVPAPISDQVKKELDFLEKSGIITKVNEPTEYVNPMVCIRKPSGRVRICIDPTDLNRVILREHHPMSTIDDIATRLNSSQWFTVLDTNMGFYQIKLSEESSRYTTFNTPFGRYRHLRMPMGISSAPEI